MQARRLTRTSELGAGRWLAAALGFICMVWMFFLILDPLLPLVTRMKSLSGWRQVAAFFGMSVMLYPIFELFERWLFDLSDDDDEEEDEERLAMKHRVFGAEEGACRKAGCHPPPQGHTRQHGDTRSQALSTPVAGASTMRRQMTTRPCT